jgi:hypothetical protein
MDDLTGLGTAREQETCVRVEQLTDLIKDIEEMRVPDRRLDAEISALFWPDFRGFQEGYEGICLSTAVNEVIVDDYDFLGSIAEIYDLPHLTSDFDAALTLLDDVPFDFFRYADGSYQAVLGTGTGETWRGTGAWPSVAVLVAVLRSMLAKDGV